VERSSTRGVLALRPLTVGELLDAALVLLRTRARTLLLVGLLLAAAEQAILYQLRGAARVGTTLIPRDGYVAEWWTLVATGFGTEAAAVAVCGGVAGAAVLPALLGARVVRPRRSTAAVVAAVAPVAVVVGFLAAAGAALLLLPWMIVYAFLGLAAPAVLVDRRGPGGALVRSLKLVAKSGLRPGMIRLLGYGGWLMFRLALSAGAAAVLDLIPRLPGGAWADLVPIASWLLVNALAYPVLGCLDAVLHIEARMRVEGLDIALGRALRRREPLEPILAVP
jgi:hypothetical protein